MSVAYEVPNRLQNKIKETAGQARSQPGQTGEAPSDNALKQEIKDQLLQQDAVLVAHYYVDQSLQDLADESGGTVADSLEMARFGYEHDAKTVIVAGVKFMGETSKILSPHKKVLLLEKEAECSLDIGCPVEEFSAFCDQHPDRTVVVYANTSAEVKARADWVVTSSIALPIVNHLKQRGDKIIWGPDKYLGSYIKDQTGADMLMWQGACIVHEEFKAEQLADMKLEYPEAAVLVHPESPKSVVELADVVGSTSRLLGATQELPNQTFIVATEDGIFHKMKQNAPNKRFIAAPTAGRGASCVSCARCPWMKMNDLYKLASILRTGSNEIHIEESVRLAAQRSLKRMVDFAKDNSSD